MTRNSTTAGATYAARHQGGPLAQAAARERLTACLTARAALDGLPIPATVIADADAAVEQARRDLDLQTRLGRR